MSLVMVYHALPVFSVLARRRNYVRALRLRRRDYNPQMKLRAPKKRIKLSPRLRSRPKTCPLILCFKHKVIRLARAERLVRRRVWLDGQTRLTCRGYSTPSKGGTRARV